VRRLPTRIPLLLAGLLLVLTACSEPPQKEIDQAQAAVDLARTGGADRYATEEYAAAVAGVQKAHAAVDQRDYRQALSYAIDARQRAQDALRQAAEAKKRAQRETEADYSAAATRANRLQALIRETDGARAKVKDLAALSKTLAEARTVLQEASTAITLGDFAVASKSLTEVREKLDAAIGGLENIPPRPARGGRVKSSSAPRTTPRPSR
jgi:multidrug efflux pump subunit AcrA (membrane-fusion protein)